MSDVKPKLGGFILEPDNPKHWSYEDKLKPKMKAGPSGGVDLRGFTSPRHDQRNTGTCVAQSVVKVLLQSIYIAAGDRLIRSEKLADVVIRPDVSYLGAEDFGRVKEFIVQGEIAAEEAIPELKRRLGSISPKPRPPE